jgi:membrane fusion protein (multidrug efflux system)
LQLDALPGEFFTAAVARTGTVLDVGNRTMRVEFDVPNRQHRLRPGMTASLSLELQRFDNAITVPVSALHTQGKSRTVFVVEQGKGIQRQVRTGLESPEWIQVTEGLSGGEEVIVASSSSLTNDTKVKVSQ